jgi:ribonuclease-3
MTEIETILNYGFRNRNLLQNALIHKSFNEGSKKDLPDNEKLEFLGDSVINLVVTEALYKRFTTWNEGDLSKLKAHLVSSSFLYDLAVTLGLNQFLVLGKGEEKNDGRQNPKIIACLFEAVVGAIYLDCNFRVTSQTVLPLFEPFLANLQDCESRINDYKSELQELVQRHHTQLPTYRLVAQEGRPPTITFTVAVMLGDHELARGKGRNKRQAEQVAASNALGELNKEQDYQQISDVFFVTSDQ